MELAQENLIFVVCAPRSGSTLLQRMLGSHSKVYTHPEPHLVTPLAYLGYHATVDAAPYDHINAAQAMRELVEELPRGEEDYLDALRAYATTIYGRVLAPTGKPIFLDKTPAYGLVLPFLAKLFPRARYVVLTRHPLAILHSQAHSFFNGDYAAANDTNPLVGPYVDGIGGFIRRHEVPFVRTRYEDLVANPESEMRRVLSHLDLPFEAATITYGEQKHISKSYGDPMSVEKHTRPVTDSVDRWASDLAARPEGLAMARAIVGELEGEDLEAWGYPKESMFAALDGRHGEATRAPFNGYRLKRQILLALRKNIHGSALGSAVKKVRYYCDVLLRT